MIAEKTRDEWEAREVAYKEKIAGLVASVSELRGEWCDLLVFIYFYFWFCCWRRTETDGVFLGFV